MVGLSTTRWRPVSNAVRSRWLAKAGRVSYTAAREALGGVIGAVRVTWSGRAAALHAGAILGGWALLTAGVASLLVPEVWLISAGLLLLSLAGWGHLRVLFGKGVYALTRKVG